MAQFYSDPSRETHKWSLPDCEVFYSRECDQTPETVFWNEDDDEATGPGWYYWTCFPGCMPDSDPWGPFDSEDAAIEDAREQAYS